MSFHDSEVRPIRKGKLNKAVEFGRTLQLVQDSSGVIVHYEVHRGNPSDRTKLLSVLRQAKTAVGIKPKELAADRGYYSCDNVLKLSKAGIEKIGIPKVGRLSSSEKTHQRKKWFRQLQRFRCGIEASISMLKRKFGLGRVLAKGSAANGYLDRIGDLLLQPVAKNLSDDELQRLFSSTSQIHSLATPCSRPKTYFFTQYEENSLTGRAARLSTGYASSMKLTEKRATLKSRY